MTEALLVNGERFFLLPAKENFDKSSQFLWKALEMSKENKLDKQIARSYLALSSIPTVRAWCNKSFGYVNETFSYVTILNDDSLKALSFYWAGKHMASKKIIITSEFS